MLGRRPRVGSRMPALIAMLVFYYGVVRFAGGNGYSFGYHMVRRVGSAFVVDVGR